MAIGLFVPVFVPAIDHHYADRSPAHSHLLLGEITNSHEHTVDLDNHSHIVVDGETGDGLSVATYSATSVHSPVTLEFVGLGPVIPLFNDHQALFGRQELTSTDQETTTPLDKPPRVS